MAGLESFSKIKDKISEMESQENEKNPEKPEGWPLND
jgi:hypothetical protein